MKPAEIEPVYPEGFEFHTYGNVVGDSLMKEILRHYVKTGALADYVEKHGVDGKKEQT